MGEMDKCTDVLASYRWESGRKLRNRRDGKMYRCTCLLQVGEQDGSCSMGEMDKCTDVLASYRQESGQKLQNGRDG